MTDNDKLINSILNQHKDKLKPLIPIEQILKQLGAVTEYMSHLEGALINMSHEVQAQGLGLQMVLRMFVDKGICTEEEIKEYHTKYVFEPMRKAAKEMHEKMQAAEQEANKCDIKCDCAEETKEEPEEEIKDSDVVLASEKSNVVKFPNGK